jgi:hypothetical protein
VKPAVRPSALPPKTLVLRDVADYLGLGSPQAAERWLKAHQVRIFPDKLGYNRAVVREIDAANNHSYAEAEEREREGRARLKEAG